MNTKLDSFWPAAGPLPPGVHDPAHTDATLEWWYVHGHVEDAQGVSYTLFASWFRKSSKREVAVGQHCHALTWRLTRLHDGEERSSTLLDPQAPAEVLAGLAEGGGDPQFRRALEEVMLRGEVPTPDRMLEKPGIAHSDRLLLDYDGNLLERRPDGTYALTLRDPDGTIAIEGSVILRKPLIRHGDDGYVRGVSAETMFYYFCPRCDFDVRVFEPEGPRQLSGTAWFDHEFGRHEANDPGGATLSGHIAWNWIAVQLSCGWEITAYDLFDIQDEGRSAGRWLIAIDPDGNRHAVEGFSLETTDTWRSYRTFIDWPVAWRLEVPELDLVLEAVAPVPSQEYQTLISAPAFWEGRVDVTGRFRDAEVIGRGFVERSGFETDRGIRGMLDSVGQATRDAVRTVLPRRPTREQLDQLIGGEPLPDLDPERVGEFVVAPIRHVVDQGGKAWRSFALLAAVNLVGGDPQPFARWLAIPEVIHVGSLMVDDVQDRSTLRRGEAPAHLLWGEPIAINAGCAAYFLTYHLINDADLPDATKVRLYDQYFHTMRAAHVGQALDLHGLHDVMQSAISTNDLDGLLAKVLLTHRLKSAIPAANLGRMGAILGGATREEELAVGAFFEGLGVAFQVVDDILNLTGQGGLKERGEDLRAGKVTAPVAMALKRLPPPQRDRLSALLVQEHRTPVCVAEALELVEKSGALEDARALADTMLEEAWGAVDAVIPASFAKLQMRGFAWYLLERAA